MKYKSRDIQVFTKNVDNLNTENILNLSKSMHHDIYTYENFNKLDTGDKVNRISLIAYSYEKILQLEHILKTLFFFAIPIIRVEQ
jgi:hypothetical protein